MQVREIKIGIYGVVDAGKTSLTEELTGISFKNSIEQKYKITLYVNCNSRAYKKDGETFTQVSLDSSENKFILTTLDNPGHFKMLCNSLSNLPFIDIPLLLIDKESFNQKFFLKYFDLFDFFNFPKVIIVQTKIDLQNKEQILELSEKILNETKKYNFEVELVHYTIFSNKAKNNLLRAIESSKVKERLNLKNKIFIIKSFDKNRPGEMILKDNELLIKNQKFSGAILGGVNFFEKRNILEETIMQLGPLYLDLNNQKKEKITYIKPKILSTIKTTEELSSIVTLETSLDPGLGSSDNLSGTILFLEEDFHEQYTLEAKVKKEYFPLLLNDKIMINLLNMKLVSQVTKVKRKGILELKLAKPLPFKYTGPLIIFKQIKNINKLELAGLAEIIE